MPKFCMSLACSNLSSTPPIKEKTMGNKNNKIIEILNIGNDLPRS